MPVPEDQQQALAEFIGTLKASGQGKTHEELAQMLSGYENVEGAEGLVSADLNDKSRQTVSEVARALKTILGDIPEENLAGDWDYLCDQTRDDLLTSPATAIAGMNGVLDCIRKHDNARMS